MSAASWAFSPDLQQSNTRHRPVRANLRAARKPSPLLAPVTTTLRNRAAIAGTVSPFNARTVLMAILLVSAAYLSVAEQPNFVVLFADDWGFGDLVTHALDLPLYVYYIVCSPSQCFIYHM